MQPYSASMGWGSAADLSALFVLVAVLMIFPKSAWSQFSPGPLAEVHEEWEGALNCLQCHALGKDMALNDKCLECHEGIAWLVDRDRGLHGREGRSDCAACHPEHGGRDFQLIDEATLKPEAFDHERAGWPLQGKHKEAGCEKCHNQNFRLSKVLELLQSGNSGRAWIGLDGDCASCHEDVHKGRLGTNCADCHTARSFHEVVGDRFDHSKTRYGLRGAHTQLTCAVCHDSDKAWGRFPRFEKCGDCHTDPHAGKATLAGAYADCAGCHNEESFRPSTFTVAMHDASRFPLRGNHRDASCEKCHAKEDSGPARVERGDAGVLLRPLFKQCSECHKDAHEGQLAARNDKGACEACHTPDGWRPSTFDIKDHGSTSFDLTGGHARANCASCHGPEREFLPPLPDRELLGRAGVAFYPASETCGECHRDAHDARYPGDHPEKKCEQCHDTELFRPALVDAAFHNRFEYKLEGAHRAVPCMECHADLKDIQAGSSLLLAVSERVPIRFEVEHSTCGSCHADQHGGQFEKSCESCHDSVAFRPAGRFNHETDSIFPLQGAHADVACRECHLADPKLASAAVRYKPLDGRCESCHTTGELKEDGSSGGRS